MCEINLFSEAQEASAVGWLDIAQVSVAFVALIVSGLAVWLAKKAGQKSNEHMDAEKRTWERQNFFYIHQFLSGEHYVKARHRLRMAISDKESYNSEDHEEAINLVCTSYDQAGLLLLDKRLINEDDRAKFLSSSWGESIVHQHEIIQKFETERKDKEDSTTFTTLTFFTHFVELYEEAVLAQKDKS